MISSSIRPKNSQGFTLVELLIAIVVIAILASISVVTYSGIQQRATAAKISTVVDSYYKVFEAVAATEGAYPDLGYGCLGVANDYPADSPFAEGACVMTGGSVNSELDPDLQAALSSNISSLPSAKLAPVSVTYGSDTYHYRGIWMNSRPTYFEFQYWLKGDKECTRGNKSYSSSVDATRCNVFWGTFS